jgi:hypothetical protein
MANVKIILPSANKLIRKKGLAQDGKVQMFHTQNCLRRIKRYMPFLSGATYKITVAQTNIRKPEIVTNVPYGKYLFYGKVMVNSKTGKGPALIPGVGCRFPKGSTLMPTDRELEYTKTKNPLAGPHWDRTLVAYEGKAIVSDLQRYINSGR